MIHQVKVYIFYVGNILSQSASNGGYHPPENILKFNVFTELKGSLLGSKDDLMRLCFYPKLVLISQFDYDNQIIKLSIALTFT